LTNANAKFGILLVSWLALAAPLAAQEGESALDARLEALEERMKEQQAAFENQRKFLERTIREQQQDLQAQQRQLSAQYELIQQLQAKQKALESAGDEIAAARTAEDSTARDEQAVVSSNGSSEGQLAAEAEFTKRTAAGQVGDQVNAQATLYDPSNTVFDPDFPGAWHLPGTTSAMKIGGFVNLGLINSFDPVAITDRFIVGSIPPEGRTVTGARSGMDVTASQTRLNFEVRQQTKYATLRAFIEGDFEGEGEAFRLRHAFGQYRYLLAGKTWSTFANVNALPEEVDYEGVNGVVLRRQPQLRVFPEFGQDFSFVFSIEEPQTDITNGTGTKGAWDLVASVDRLPLGELGSWNYRVSGILRDLKGQFGEADASGGEVAKGSATGWGVTTSGRMQFEKSGENDFLLWQVTYGKGIGRYLNDLSTIGGGDAVFDSQGKLHALPVLAGFLSYRHQWGSKPWFLKELPGFMRSNFTVSWISVDNFEFQDGEDYAETWRTSANLLYFPTQNLRIGGELLWGQRENKDGSKGTATQLQLSARYSF